MNGSKDHDGGDPRPPGWYVDPRDPQRHRYWDGKKWSELSTTTPPEDPSDEARADRTPPISTGTLADRRIPLILAVGAVAVAVLLGIGIWAFGRDDGPDNRATGTGSTAATGSDSTETSQDLQGQADQGGPDSGDGSTTSTDNPAPGGDVGPTQQTDPGSGPACSVDESELLQGLKAHPPLESFADELQVSGTTCSGEWASTVVKATETDSALALFRSDNGSWTLVLVGSAEPCSGLGIPPESEEALGCTRW